MTGSKPTRIDRASAIVTGAAIGCIPLAIMYGLWHMPSEVPAPPADNTTPDVPLLFGAAEQAHACAIVIGNADKELELNFCGDEMTVTGDLGYSEAAKIFFDYVDLECRRKE